MPTRIVSSTLSDILTVTSPSSDALGGPKNGTLNWLAHGFSTECQPPRQTDRRWSKWSSPLNSKSVRYPEILEVSPLEFDTILAALCFWQRQALPQRHIHPEWALATERGAPLSASAIDALCLRLRKNSPSRRLVAPSLQSATRVTAESFSRDAALCPRRAPSGGDGDL